MKKIIVLTVLATLLASDFKAQEQTVLDGAYVKEHNATKRVIPYPPLREADVMWSKRIWRKIDLREKMNHPFFYPRTDIEDRKSLFGVIRHALLVEGSLTAYGLGPAFNDDEFRYPMNQNEVDTLLNPVVTRYVENLVTGELEPVETPEPIESSIVTEYVIKEDWIFDKQRSERYVRIIGIAPKAEDKDPATGEKRGNKWLFWLYFPECRYVFANADVYNRQNDAQRRTFEDLFQQRMFASYIIKESNVYDRDIQDYAIGLDALLEAENIKGDLFLIEHDLWHY
jgi:gliding motility associated protien GldN